MTTAEVDSGGEDFPARDILRRILSQRALRYTDRGPDLGRLGSARFRQEGDRLLIGYASLEPNTMSEAIERVVDYARSHGMRVVWTVTQENAGEDALPATLRAHGFVLDERLILMARRNELHARVNPAVSVTPITSWSVMWAYEHGSRRSFYNDPSPDNDIVTARASERWRQQEIGWYRYYAAFLANQFAGGLYVSQWEDVPTLIGVYTLDSARRQGVATTALAHAIHDLAQAGRSDYCLYVKADNPARQLYQELGFQTLGVEEIYIRDV